MAVLTSNNLTLLDWAKRSDPSGSIPLIAELLSQNNNILSEMVYREGNLPTGEQVTIRTGLPVAYWRQYNEKIPASESQTAQVTETCGMLEAKSEVDKALADLNGNTKAFRLSETSAFIESMNQTMTKTLFYGGEPSYNGAPAANSKEFLGIAPRYSTLTAGNAQNILNAGGTTASGANSKNTSIYLVAWGDQTVYGIFPRGSKAGLMHEDLGRQTIRDGSGNSMEGYVDRFVWNNGLVVKDWRYVVRICNVDTVDIKGQINTQTPTAVTNILKLMANATYCLPESKGRAAFYMNRTIHSALSNMALDKSSAVLAVQQGLSQFGTATSWLSFLGIPLRRCDAIVNSENKIV